MTFEECASKIQSLFIEIHDLAEPYSQIDIALFVSFGNENRMYSSKKCTGAFLIALAQGVIEELKKRYNFDSFDDLPKLGYLLPAPEKH